MYIKVKVTTKAKKEAIKKIRDDYYEISLREPAERNLANSRILEIIRTLHKGSVRMISGHHSPSKIISVDY
jgi:uncharacterized protein YggU (UPF0235/DUF167 family)